MIVKSTTIRSISISTMALLNFSLSTIVLFTWITLIMSSLLQVQVQEGTLEGIVEHNQYGLPFISFKGIPYAEPPVGKLRFKAPQRKIPWNGVRNAKELGSACFHYEIFTNETVPNVGSEDCLFLNVFTLTLTPLKPLPVMVFIHGGGFASGSSDDSFYGPKFLVRKNVILVTLNYRLEVLGFLCLHTEDIPGNAGIKDQVAALRWIKKNINKFGGDPENITIFGESAGAASVSFHLVSPMSKGLFNRAIVQSGSLTGWWPHTFRARDRALELAKQLGCTSNDDKDVYDFFMAQPVENLVRHKTTVTYVQFAKESPNVYYGIVPEKQFGENERFFYGHPYEVLRNGIHEGVQVMNGYTADEGILYFTTGVQADEVFKQANRFIEFFVPEPYTVNTPLKTQLEIGQRFKDYYMKNKTVSRETIDDLLQYFNLEIFVYSAMSLQKILADTTPDNHYLYKFTCVSELNIFTPSTGIDDLFSHRPVVAHSDDLGYIFSSDLFPNISMESNTFKMIDQVTTLWTNFAKYGDPTPDESLGVKWLPYNLKQQDYLDIGEDLVPGKYPEKEAIDLWENTFKEFLPELAPLKSNSVKIYTISSSILYILCFSILLKL